MSSDIVFCVKHSRFDYFISCVLALIVSRFLEVLYVIFFVVLVVVIVFFFFFLGRGVILFVLSPCVQTFCPPDRMLLLLSSALGLPSKPWIIFSF